MDKYFDIFIKSIISACGISFVGGVVFIVKILITYNDTLNNIEKRMNTFENSQSVSNDKINMMYNYYVINKHDKDK